MNGERTPPYMYALRKLYWEPTLANECKICVSAVVKPTPKTETDPLGDVSCQSYHVPPAL